MATQQAFDDVDVERGKARVAEIMSSAAARHPELEPPSPKPERRPRSDKGTHKPKKEEVRRTEFEWRVEDLMAAERDVLNAEIRKAKAWAEYCAFVDRALGLQ